MDTTSDEAKEILAVSTEMQELLRKRYREDPRPPEKISTIMATSLIDVLSIVIANRARGDAHIDMIAEQLAGALANMAKDAKERVSSKS
jgi:hypothetical protein